MLFLTFIRKTLAVLGIVSLLVQSPCLVNSFTFQNRRYSFSNFHRRAFLPSPSSSESPLVATHLSTSANTPDGPVSPSSEAVPVSPVVTMPLKLIGKTTSVLVAGSVFAAMAYYRDAITFALFLGSVSNGILSKVLKRILNQSRPAELHESDDVIDKPGDNGMPSSHAMSLGFICTFTALNAPWAQAPLAFYSIASLIYRVQVKLHTWEQVVVGLVVGSTNGYAWWHLTVGDNPFGICVGDWISAHLLDATTGLLPYHMLAVPLVIGGLTVGSFERRIGRILEKVQRKND